MELLTPTPAERRAEDERRHLADLADHRATIAELGHALVLLAAATGRDLARLDDEAAASIAGIQVSLAAADEHRAAETARADAAEGALERLMELLVREVACAPGQEARAVRRLRSALRTMAER